MVSSCGGKRKRGFFYYASVKSNVKAKEVGENTISL